MFLKHAGVRNSNEAEVLVISKAFWFNNGTFQEKLIVEYDLLYAISWVNSTSLSPWNFQFFDKL